MTTFPASPRLLKGGIVLVDPVTGVVQSIITLQYNPNSITRTLKGQTMGDDADRSQALRLTGPPTETYKLDAEIDAADQLESPNSKHHKEIVENGILSHLAALETILYPASTALVLNNTLASVGTLEVIPTEAPLSLFVWSQNRVLPVRITDLSITEEAFDPNLNPIRAKVSLGLRVLNVNDLGFMHRGGSLYLAYHKNLEYLSTRITGGLLGDLGITGV